MRAEMLDSILTELNAVSPSVDASAILSYDGLVMATALPAGMEEDRLSAMAAAMLSLGERALAELSRGSMEQMVVKGTEGLIILHRATDDALLLVLARADVRLGITLLDIKRSTKDIKDLL